MASKKERITALFSMYKDDDDDDEEEEEEEENVPVPAPSNRASSPRSPLRPNEPSSSDRKNLTSPRAPTPSQIVDYGHAHDEMAASPEHDVHMYRDDMQTSRSPIADNLEKSKSDGSMAVDIAKSDHEMIQAEETGTNSAGTQNDDPLTRFLGPPLKEKCSDALQVKINRFLEIKRGGRSFNAAVRNKKDYRNPDFLQHAVTYQDIDEIGTCFSKEVFNPYGYDKSDYYDEIEVDMKREQERKEQERKKSPKLDFISGGIQPSPVIPTILKPNSIPTLPTGDANTRETRNKKSKWDKVEGDVTNSVPPTGAAAVLTQSAIGGGYSGFAQQKRKEAEDKKANDKKSDKRT